MLSFLLLKPFLRQDAELSCLSPIKNFIKDNVPVHVLVFTGILSLLHFFYGQRSYPQFQVLQDFIECYNQAWLQFTVTMSLIAEFSLHKFNCFKCEFVFDVLTDVLYVQGLL